jgi:hypothetical protein
MSVSNLVITGEHERHVPLARFNGTSEEFQNGFLVGDSVPKPLGFIALAPEWLLGLRSGYRRPEPFRQLSRRSGRIPALPYPPPR